ncbi:angiotensin-converting enzyme-like [Ctenocephalides felis]|uniref:angiotensin-converting enzyme-like n=1 Tax=Ctenocephalides felis TaxID=7515 RepID=UPI000E6E27B9|nr:angiotensin-converting enzyme-like [Ctenocephalides felis]
MIELTLKVLILAISLSTLTLGAKTDFDQEEEKAANFLELIEQPNIDWYNRIGLANWDYNTNITKENAEKKKKVNAEYALYRKLQLAEASKFNWRQFKDEDLKRQFKLHLKLGDSILNEHKYRRLQDIQNEMKTNYATAKICDYKNRKKCDLELDSDVNEIFAKSRNAKELQYVWEQWRNVAGAPIRKLYSEYVELKNEAARLNNYTDVAEMWLSEYDTKDFEDELSSILRELKPLYNQLHAYVRYKLRRHYSVEVVSERGPIPAHLLGNNWAQNGLKLKILLNRIRTQMGQI